MAPGADRGVADRGGLSPDHGPRGGPPGSFVVGGRRCGEARRSGGGCGQGPFDPRRGRRAGRGPNGTPRPLAGSPRRWRTDPSSPGSRPALRHRYGRPHEGHILTGLDPEDQHEVIDARPIGPPRVGPRGDGSAASGRCGTAADQQQQTPARPGQPARPLRPLRPRRCCCRRFARGRRRPLPGGPLAAPGRATRDDLPPGITSRQNGRQGLLVGGHVRP
jgi:hypothetical protein